MTAGVLMLTLALADPAAAQRMCEQGETELFICQTDSHDKYLGICAVEDRPGETWSAVQYRFGDFASYLRMALACDLENPHGKAGCAEPPPHERN